MPRSSSPAFIEPMTAKLVEALPEGEQWIYEVKFDGYRALLLKDGGHVQIRSRNDNNLTATYPTITAAASRLKADTALLDGEIVALDAEGRPSFQALQHRSAHRGYAIVFYAFDLLHLNGETITRLPLEARRQRLPDVVKGSGILLSEPLRGTPAQLIQAVSQLGLEGIDLAAVDPAVVLKSRDEAIAPFQRIQTGIVLIGLLCAAAAALGVFWTIRSAAPTTT